LKLQIINTQQHERGKLCHVRADGKVVTILLTFHAVERAQRWKLGERQVIRTLLEPEEVLRGHRNRYIAHRRIGKHVVRAIYEYDNRRPVVITVYFPLAERYFEGGGVYEDKILS